MSDYTIKTIDELKKMTMPALRSYVEELCAPYSLHTNAEEIGDAAIIDKSQKDAIKEYNEKARLATFSEVCKEKNVLYAACQKLYYDTICVKNSKVEGSVYRTCEDDVKAIDMLKLFEYGKDRSITVGADTHWKYEIETLGLRLTINVNELLLTDAENKKASKEVLAERIKTICKTYKMSKFAREILDGKTPQSKTKIIDNTKTIFQMMFGTDEEFKVTPKSFNVEKMMMSFTKDVPKDASIIDCADSKKLTAIIAGLAHCIINGIPYGTRYKQEK